MRKFPRQLAWALVLACALHFSLSTWHVFRFMTHAHEWVGLPVAISPDGRVNHVEPEAAAGGLRIGDRIETAGGVRLQGLWSLREILKTRRVHEDLPVAVTREDGTAFAGSVRLEPYFGEKADWHDWAKMLSTHVVTPLICVALAFYVLAFVRFDKKAALLLLILVGFAMLVPLGGWSVPLFPFALLLNDWAQTTVGAWLFLFALYFPEPGGIGMKPRWLRGVAVASTGVFFVSRVLSDALIYWGPGALASRLPWTAIGRLSAVFSFAGFLLFAVNLGVKAFRMKDRDSRRRLRILFLGAFAGVGPIILLLIRSALTGRSIVESAPGWVLDWSVLAIGIFPVTLAYVVAVRRAMDVRVMLRQGLYYSAAQQGLFVLRLGSVVIVFVTVASLLAGTELTPLQRWSCVAAGGVALIFIQEVVLGRLKSWIEQRLIREAYRLDELMSQLRRERNADPDWFLSTILKAACHSIGAVGGSVHVKSGDGFRAVFSLDLPRPLHIEPGPLSEALEAARGPITLDRHNPPEWALNSSFHEGGVEMIVPFHGSDGLAGVLTLGAKESGEPYTQTDRAALAAIEETAGLVLENLLLMAARDSETADRERRKAEAQAAEEANRAKSEFLAKMSHELRTPLNAIIGYSEMLTEEAEDLGEQGFVKDLTKIRTAGKHLLDLINSVLDISKIEAGKMEVYAETFRVEQLISDVSGMLSPVIGAKGNRLAIEVARDCGTMHSDAGKIRQILINLLSNASKFTDAGVITLTCRRTAAGLMRFAVRDTGIGMTPQQMEKLFQPFQQADASISAKYGGTGLGLTICKRFCELLGGAITLRSELGAGTEFAAELPPAYGEAPQMSLMFEPSGPKDAPLVLIIDDDPAIHDLFTRSLAKEGFRTASAFCAEDGIRMALELVPDAILLDLMLGGVNGWTVMAELRRTVAEGAPPVILMSILDEKHKGIALGADGFLVKPVEKQQLKQALNSALKRRKQAIPRVLVVDDEPVNRLALRRMLQSEGWRVSEGANGREGLEIVDREQLTAVLMDPMTPVMDGFGFLLELRARPGGTDLPVIVVAAKDLTEKERLLLKQSIEAILRKDGNSPDELAAIGDLAAREVVVRLRNKAMANAENIIG